jgi:hypothetical protein
MESEFVTVMTFIHVQEMWTVRTMLETRGIECFTRDELTAQAATYYARAVGGIKLQVRQQDAERTLRLLIDAGYLSEKALEPVKPTFDVDEFTSKYPIFKKRSFRILLFVLVVLLILVLGTVVYRSSQPSAFEVLTQNDWCLANVTYKNKKYSPQTVRDLYFSSGICAESITFYRDGTIRLPGFQSDIVRGKWQLKENQLHISDTDTFDFVYNGVYDIDVDRNFLDLKSVHSTLNCYVKTDGTN